MALDASMLRRGIPLVDPAVHGYSSQYPWTAGAPISSPAVRLQYAYFER